MRGMDVVAFGCRIEERDLCVARRRSVVYYCSKPVCWGELGGWGDTGSKCDVCVFFLGVHRAGREQRMPRLNGWFFKRAGTPRFFLVLRKEGRGW